MPADVPRRRQWPAHSQISSPKLEAPVFTPEFYCDENGPGSDPDDPGRAFAKSFSQHGIRQVENHASPERVDSPGE